MKKNDNGFSPTNIREIRLDLYRKLAEAEVEAATGFDGHPFDEVMTELMADLKDDQHKINY